MAITFTSEDANVLKQVTKVEDLGNAAARLVLLKPVADFILAMGDPVEFTAEVVQADLPGIATAAKNIAKIASCTAYEIVAGHIETGNPPPVGVALDYFKELADSLEARCNG